MNWPMTHRHRKQRAHCVSHERVGLTSLTVTTGGGGSGGLHTISFGTSMRFSCRHLLLSLSLFFCFAFAFLSFGTQSKMAAAGGDLTPERLSGMKSAIHSFLADANVYGSLREIVDSYVADNAGASLSPDSPSDILRIVKERGVLQQLLERMRSASGSTVAGAAKTLLVPGDGQFYLHVRLCGGRAFVDNLDISATAGKHLRLFAAVHFGSQRFRSTLQPCSSSPQFDDDFVFRLDPTCFGFPDNDLIEVSTPFHIAVFREDTRQNVAELLGENIIDWRKTLKTGYLGLTVELCGANAGVPAGVIEMQFELIAATNVRYSESEVAERLDQQRTAITTADREFLVYARRWWSEYQGLRTSHRERKVKVFAETTNGRMVPLTHFVSPLQADFAVNSPLEAARFVSLLKTHESADGAAGLQALENSSAHTWLPPFVFLSQRQGHHCNHAALLCSLLLGFGLDAYCAIGTNTGGATCVFVVTRTKGGNGEFQVTTWDPTSADRVPLNGAHHFATIDCLFNHRALYANVQASNTTVATSLDVDNEELWKPLNTLKLRIVPRYPGAPLLCEPMNVWTAEKGVEMKLRQRVVSYRESFGTTTAFDDDLTYSLSQALNSYEVQRTTGKTEDFSLFELCVKGILGPGKTFKAIPINVAHTDDGSIASAIQTNAAGKEILETVADDVKYGIRARVYPFPEGVCSVWVIVAVAYRVRAAEQ